MSIPGQTMGVSAFTDPLIKALSISRDELSLAYMLGTIASSFMLPWAGKQYDQYGVRPIAFIATLGLGISLTLLSMVDQLFVWIQSKNHLAKPAILFLCFLSIRFFGQGVLTMVSRNMVVQWFEKKRGLTSGLSNVVVSLTFSLAPAQLFLMIENYTWQGTWRILALVVGVIFPVIVLIFFRNKPEDSGLVPDGISNRVPNRVPNRISSRILSGITSKNKISLMPDHIKSKYVFEINHNFNLKQVRKNYAFWVFGLSLAMQALYVTGFTFHVTNIFEQQGIHNSVAVAIFRPAAYVAVLTTLIFSTLSDYVPLKYLYLIKGFGAVIGILGMILIGKSVIATSLIIAGNGTMIGLFSVLTSVTWPRYFGREHLGAISGQAVMLMVFGSALGPALFSLSLSQTGSYNVAGWSCLTGYLILTVLAIWSNNPQTIIARKE